MPRRSIYMNTSNIKLAVFGTSSFTLALLLATMGQAHADSMSALIAQKSASAELSARHSPPSSSMFLSVPSARIETRSTIKRAGASGHNDGYQYPNSSYQRPSVLPAFLMGNYDNIDSEYLPILGQAETQSSRAAKEVISTARAMALNERTIIQGGCWDYLNAVFKRAGVTRDTVHKGAYRQGPYANSSEIQAGDWLYYINHGYKGIEHSGLFVGWVDESAKQALMLSYAGENRREPARYKVYDLSNVYQIMRPAI